MVLCYINETTVERIINSTPNENSKDEFSLSNAFSKKTNLFSDSCLNKTF